MRRVVWSVIAVGSAIRLLVIASSYWWQDDYVHMWDAWWQSFGMFVTKDWNGHLQPGSMTFYWIMTRLWPQQFWAAVVVLGTLAIALPVVFWKAMSRLGGVTYPVAISACTFAVWPGLLGPLTWLAAGLETISVLCLLLGLWAFASRSRFRTTLVILALLGGLLFNERALFMLPVLVLTAILFTQGPLRQRIRAVWTGGRGLWLVLTGVTLAVVIARMTRTPQASGGGGTSVWEFLQGLWFGGPMGAVSSLAGVTLTWPDERTTVPSSPSVLAWMWVLIVVGCLLYYGWRRSRRQVLLVVGTWLAVLVVESLLIDIFRGGFIGPQVHMDPRYSLVSGVMLLIGIASFGPLAKDVESRRVRAPVVILSVGVCLTSLVSAWTIRQVVAGSSSQAWFNTAREAFTQGDSPPLVATPSPPFMLNDLFVQQDARGNIFELGTVRTLLQVGPRQPRFGEATLLPVGVDNEGRPAPAVVDPIKSTTALGFGENCSVSVGRGWVTVPMSIAGLGNPVLAADYLASGPTLVQVRAGDWSSTLRLESGFKTMWFTPEPGPWSGFEIRTVDGSAICLGSARAGNPRALQTP